MLFKCFTCDSKFIKKHTLTKHIIRFHKESKEYKCPICDKEFPKKIALRIHLTSIHKKEKPHKCTKCDAKFSFKSNMKKHMKIHENIHKCSSCDFCYSNPKELKIHNKQVHRNIQQKTKDSEDLDMDVSEDKKEVVRRKIRNKKDNIQKIKRARQQNSSLVCSVSFCQTSFMVRSKADFHKHGFYKIPEDPVRRKKWIEACKFQPNVCEDIMICWKHFLTSDFVTEMDPKFIDMVLELGRKLPLKELAVPTQLLPKVSLDLIPKSEVKNNSNVKVDSDGAPIFKRATIDNR